eukprot:93338-Chlamydomonas_euryale.AAC.1
MIGINTAIYSPSGANTGVGFAIPSHIVNASVEQIVAYGKAGSLCAFHHACGKAHHACMYENPCPAAIYLYTLPKQRMR